MTPAPWPAIEELYHAARERPPGDRDAFLREACRGDERLRQEVLSLLAEETEAERLMEEPAAAAATQGLALVRGACLGPYEVVDLLGAGGMGVVYRARDTRLGRDVALKVLAEGFAQDKTRLARFEREARVLATLSHPGIAAIHGLERGEDGPALVLELVEGEGLDERLARGRIPVPQALELARQMAAALESAHAKGIIHRDLKPSNIRLTPEGQVKLLDFGLAKALAPAEDEARTPASTTTGVVVGTPPYMSPEQVRGEALDRRTDVWSFGCVLYEMLAGGRAFPGHTAEAIAAVLEREPEWRALPSETPPQVVDLLRRCLRKDRTRRLHDVADARIELEETLARATLRRPGWSRRLAVGLGLAAGLALALTATRDGLRDRLAPARGAGRIESLAVLPLENRSGDPEQEYLADGMTDALITALGRIRTLRVISFTSAMQYKAVRKPLPDVARDLQVEAVVEGSVLQAGDRVRVTARLVGAAPERQLWTGSYDRQMGDILGLSSEVARAISREVRVALTPEDVARLAPARPVAPEVQEAYLKGRYFLDQLTEEGARKSLEHFQRAIDKDPESALGYAGLAAYFTGHDEPSKAKEMALRALELDETLVEAHVALARIAIFHDWDWDTAGRELERALELDPVDSDAHLASTTLLYVEGRVDEAIERAEAVLRLDPLSPLLNDMLISAYAAARRYDEAIALCRRALEMYPDRSWTHYWLGYAYLGKGAHAEAIAELERAVALSGGSSADATMGLARAYALSGRADEARSLVSKLSSRSNVAAVQVALGEREEALASLKEALDSRDSDVVFLKTDPQFDSLRSDPRFQKLLARLNLPE
jgi:TolB-like protein/Tfp pilus assembly protein PilF